MPVLVIEIPWGPDIFTIGGFILTWHGVFTAVGILAGVQLALRIGRAVGYDEDQAYTLALVGIPGGIVGARALFVAEHWAYYSQSLGEILALNEGGISVWGALLGGLGTAALFARWRGYPIARGLDITAFGSALGLAIGRLGDLVNGEHLGRATSLPWAVVYTDPQSPAFAYSLTAGPHHPATGYELFGLLAVLGLLWFALFRVFRDRAALTFLLFIDSYAVLRFFLTYLRVDSDVIAFGLRTPQLLAVIVLALSVPALWWALRLPRQPFGATVPPRTGPPQTGPPRTPPSTGRVAVRRR